MQPVPRLRSQRQSTAQRDSGAVVALRDAHNARVGKGARSVGDVVRGSEAEGVVVGWLVSLLGIGGDGGAGEHPLPGAAVHAHVQVVPRHPRLRVRGVPSDGDKGNGCVLSQRLTTQR